MARRSFASSSESAWSPIKNDRMKLYAHAKELQREREREREWCVGWIWPWL